MSFNIKSRMIHLYSRVVNHRQTKLTLSDFQIDISNPLPAYSCAKIFLNKVFIYKL